MSDPRRNTCPRCGGDGEVFQYATFSDVSCPECTVPPDLAEALAERRDERRNTRRSNVDRAEAIVGRITSENELLSTTYSQRDHDSWLASLAWAGIPEDASHVFADELAATHPNDAGWLAYQFAQAWGRQVQEADDA